jgi:hypothetical protein
MNPPGSLEVDVAFGQSQSSIGGRDDIIGEKAEYVVRIGFNNINGLGVQVTDGKTQDIFGFLKQNKFDIFRMAEINIHWKNNTAQAQDIMYGWFHRLHVSQSYYKNFPTPAVFQAGGYCS